MVDDKSDESEAGKEVTTEKRNKSNVDSEVVPPELMKQIPPEAQQQIRQMIAMFGQVSGPVHPLAKKLTEGHITKIIDNIEKDEDRRFQEGRDVRKMGLTIFFAILIVLASLMVFFTVMNRTDILIPLVSALVGFGGGYGIGRSRQ
jgi:hypothetical protein